MNPQNLGRSIYPLLGVIVILAIWQLYTSLSGISPLVLPSPMEIASVSIKRYDLAAAADLADLRRDNSGLRVGAADRHSAGGVRRQFAPAQSRALSDTGRDAVDSESRDRADHFGVVWTGHQLEAGIGFPGRVLPDCRGYGDGPDRRRPPDCWILPTPYAHRRARCSSRFRCRRPCPSYSPDQKWP